MSVLLQAFDLHALATPPAFILSQDQTLKKFDRLVENLRFRVYDSVFQNGQMFF